MPQSWKQGQVRLIPNNDKPQTIDDAQLITLLNAHHNMHSHMVALWLRDSMTTLCLASHCAFIASRHITLSLSTIFVNFSHLFIFTEIVLTSSSQFRKFSNCKLQKILKTFAIREGFTVITSPISPLTHANHPFLSRVESSRLMDSVGVTMPFVGFCQWTYWERATRMV